MSFSFADPTGGGDQWKAAEHVGRLVAFVEPSRESDIPTKFGTTEATKCAYIVVLDGANPGTVFDNPLVFGNISRDAYSNGEKIVLGRVAIGQAKAGQSAPYILNAATDDDKALADKWFTANASLNPAGRILISA